MEFNSYPVSKQPGEPGLLASEALNLYEITENLEEYYRQKAPNLWNAWIRTNNMLVEQQEKINQILNTLNTMQDNMRTVNENVVMVGKNDAYFKKEMNEKIDKLVKQNSADKKISR